MRKPYADHPDTSGELNFSENEMEDILRESLQRNDQLMVRVGDRTIETFLNAMDATGGEKVWLERRVRLEHGDGMLPDQKGEWKAQTYVIDSMTMSAPTPE
jgi:predicted amidohydrolase YtcJ